MNEHDISVRQRRFGPRTLTEEEGYGLTEEAPIQRRGESDGYWNIRLLTHQIMGVSYRTPQMNMCLLEDFVNERTFGKYRIKHSVYVARGYQNMRFTCEAGRVDFNAREPISPADFLKRFGIAHG